jgi:hypothetical protein
MVAIGSLFEIHLLALVNPVYVSEMGYHCSKQPWCTPASSPVRRAFTIVV